MTATASAASPAAAMEREAATWHHRLVTGTIFALPVAILSMGGMLPGLEDTMRGPLVVGSLPLGWIVQAVLAALVQVGLGNHVLTAVKTVAAANALRVVPKVCSRVPALACQSVVHSMGGMLPGLQAILWGLLVVGGLLVAGIVQAVSGGSGTGMLQVLFVCSFADG